MRILVTNDDGIHGRGLAELARVASSFGDVTVVAPASQSSAASHRITLDRPLEVLEQPFEVPDVVGAYGVSGSPADCVRVAMLRLMRDARPDVIFSGVNDGYNAGVDIVYSGTIGATMEGLLFHVPSFAFSVETVAQPEVFRHYAGDIIRKLLDQGPRYDGIWNVNFPGGPVSECKGVLWDRTIAQVSFYMEEYEDGEKDHHVMLHGTPIEAHTEPMTDICALFDGYVSVGYVRNHVLLQDG